MIIGKKEITPINSKYFTLIGIIFQIILLFFDSFSGTIASLYPSGTRTFNKPSSVTLHFAMK